LAGNEKPYKGGVWPAAQHRGVGKAHYLDWHGRRTKGIENGSTNVLGN
jgi:hypothetical protein